MQEYILGGQSDFEHLALPRKTREKKMTRAVAAVKIAPALNR
jgi:hypothetical protein